MNAYTGDGKYIFISYSHKDSDYVLPIIEHLQKSFNVWYDEGIHEGEDWTLEIIRKIKFCDLFLFFVSDHSLHSRHCPREINKACECNKHFINIYIQENIPESDELEKFKFDYYNIQAFNLFKFKNSIEGINDLIKRNNDIFSVACKKVVSKRKTRKVVKAKKSYERDLPNDSFEETYVNWEKDPIVWNPPPSDYLEEPLLLEVTESNKRLADERMKIINEVFENLKVGAIVKNYTIGNSITRFNIEPAIGTSIKKIMNVFPDISMHLSRNDARFVQFIEGTNLCGIEIPNDRLIPVNFKEVFEKLPNANEHPLSIPFGKSLDGKVMCQDIDVMPHMLIVGASGSGKSVFINSIITTLIMRNSPDDLRLILVDPKTIEMTRYIEMPHLLRPIIYTAEETFDIAKRLVNEMERRYKLFIESGSATNIKEYNSDCEKNGLDKLPYIVFVLDEYADLIDKCKELSLPVVSLAQIARASGIHLIISTARPATGVITGSLKANIPTHIAFMTESTMSSVVTLGEGGAEKLLGKGDMLVQSHAISRIGTVRLQGCYVSRDEIVNVVGYLKQNYKTNYNPNFLNNVGKSTETFEKNDYPSKFTYSIAVNEEEKYQLTKKWVMTQEFVSISSIQRECCIGYVLARKIFERLQIEGVIDKKSINETGYPVLMMDFRNNDKKK